MMHNMVVIAHINAMRFAHNIFQIFLPIAPCFFPARYFWKNSIGSIVFIEVESHTYERTGRDLL
jgi:hypothetical protein